MSPLSQSHGAKFTRIMSLGAARGDLVVSNDEIAGPKVWQKIFGA